MQVSALERARRPFLCVSNLVVHVRMGRRVYGLPHTNASYPIVRLLTSLNRYPHTITLTIIITTGHFWLL